MPPCHLAPFPVELQVDSFSAPIKDMAGSKSEKVQWSFRAFPRGVCLQNVTMVRVEGIGGQMISFELSCDSIVLSVQIDEAAQPTTITYPLPGNLTI